PLATPADMAPMTPLGRDIAQRVNHPHLVTIYQPASQWVFFVFARGGDLLHAAAAEAQATVFRIGFVLLDMALIALLLHWLWREGRSPWYAVLYAWHPLTVSEIAASGHQDIVGVLPLLAAICLLVVPRRATAPAADAAEGSSGDHHGLSASTVTLSAACLALALAVKPLLPLVLAFAW